MLGVFKIFQGADHKNLGPPDKIQLLMQVNVTTVNILLKHCYHISLSSVCTHVCVCMCVRTLVVGGGVGKGLVITSSSCFMCGRKSFWNSVIAFVSLSLKLVQFKNLLFAEDLIPFLTRDKISSTWLSLCTSLTIALICSLVSRRWSWPMMHLFSISSWRFSSWKIESMQDRSPCKDTLSWKLVVVSWWNKKNEMIYIVAAQQHKQQQCHRLHLT